MSKTTAAKSDKQKAKEKEETIKFLEKAGIWVRDGKIAKADVSKAKKAVADFKLLTDKLKTLKDNLPKLRDEVPKLSQKMETLRDNPPKLRDEPKKLTDKKSVADKGKILEFTYGDDTVLVNGTTTEEAEDGKGLYIYFGEGSVEMCKDGKILVDSEYGSQGRLYRNVSNDAVEYFKKVLGSEEDVKVALGELSLILISKSRESRGTTAANDQMDAEQVKILKQIDQLVEKLGAEAKSILITGLYYNAEILIDNEDEVDETGINKADLMKKYNDMKSGSSTP